MHPIACITAFIDLLGLSSPLLNLDGLGHDSTSQEEAEALVVQALEPIQAFRQLVSDTYERFSAAPSNREYPEGLTPEQINRFEESFADTSMLRWFSDCCVISVPYTPKRPEQLMNGLVRMLTAISGVTVLLLQRGQCIRGGIEIGFGVELERGEILGAGLVKAYRLESRCARVPRVVVGPHLLGMLESPLAERALPEFREVVPNLQAMAKQLLTVDPSNSEIAFVDFLGEKMQLLYQATNTFGPFRRQMSRAVAQAIRVHSNQGNPRTLEKYEWLREYLQQTGCWDAGTTA